MSESNIILAAQVEQEFEAVGAVAALNDAGISAFYKPTATDSLLGLPGAMGCPDSFDIFIPEEAVEQARDILVTLGCIDENEPAGEDEDAATDEPKGANDASDSPAEPQTLNDLMPDNPVLAAVYKVLFAVFALVFIAVFVWLCDTAIAWVMGLFR